MKLDRRRLGRATGSTLDIISPEEAGTLAGLFRRRCERTPEGIAYRQYDAAQRAWQSHTWREMQVLAQRWQAALAGERLGPGERVAVLLRNGVEWVCFDQAAQSLALVVVPIYTTDNPENIAYILGDCGARLLLVGEIGRWHALAPLRARFPQLARVLCAGASRDIPADAGAALSFSRGLVAGEGRRIAGPGRRPARAGDDRLHLGHDRPPERRHAVASQHPVECAGRAAAGARLPRRRLSFVPSAFPCVRTHRGLLRAHHDRQHGGFRPLGAGTGRGPARHPAHHAGLGAAHLRADVRAAAARAPGKRRAGPGAVPVDRGPRLAPLRSRAASRRSAGPDGRGGVAGAAPPGCRQDPLAPGRPAAHCGCRRCADRTPAVALLHRPGPAVAAGLRPHRSVSHRHRQHAGSTTIPSRSGWRCPASSFSSATGTSCWCAAPT